MLTSTADIADIVLKQHEGQPVRVHDVADVEIDHEIPIRRRDRRWARDR